MDLIFVVHIGPPEVITNFHPQNMLFTHLVINCCEFGEGGGLSSRDTFEDAPCFSEHFIKKGIIVNTS